MATTTYELITMFRRVDQVKDYDNVKFKKVKRLGTKTKLREKSKSVHKFTCYHL